MLSDKRCKVSSQSIQKAILCLNHRLGEQKASVGMEEASICFCVHLNGRQGPFPVSPLTMKGFIVEKLTGTIRG
jgi:hypothetical protein